MQIIDFFCNLSLEQDRLAVIKPQICTVNSIAQMNLELLLKPCSSQCFVAVFGISALDGCACASGGWPVVQVRVPMQDQIWPLCKGRTMGRPSMSACSRALDDGNMRLEPTNTIKSTGARKLVSLMPKAHHRQYTWDQITANSEIFIQFLIMSSDFE